MTELAFKISKRDTKIKSKKLRRLGAVPGIIYGEFLENSIPVQMTSRDLSKVLRDNSKGSIIPLTIDNETKNCVVKDVQKNVLGEIIHVDFQYVKNNEIIKMKIPVNYLGQENLELKKLVIETHTPSIELQGQVEKIPEYIDMDVSQKNFQDKIFAKDIILPEGVSLLTDSETLLAIVNA